MASNVYWNSKLAVKCHLPIVHSIRGALSKYSFSTAPLKKTLYYFLFERPYLLNASAIHLTSASEYHESLRPFLGLPQDLPRIIIPNIVLHTPFVSHQSEREQFFKKYGLSEESPIFLICGRVDSKKGLELIPKALKLINDLSWQLLIVGPDSDGSLDGFLEALDDLSLYHSIHYLGLKEPADLTLIYSISDLLLMPSLHENFGNVALEALFYGCRVLLSRNVGMADYLSQLPPESTWGGALANDPSLWGLWLRTWVSCFDKTNRFIYDSSLMEIFSDAHIGRQWVNEYSRLL